MDQVRARVTAGSASLEVGEGGVVGVGRAAASDLQVGAGGDGSPEDLGVSRTAATVSVRDGRVWVRNDSTSQPVYLVPDTGPTRVLEGADEIASLPTPRVTVQLRGRIRTHEVQVELLGPAAPSPAGQRPGEGPATQHLLDLSPAERRILTALAEPLLTARGDLARPASYAQGAERLYLSRSRVENCVADLVKKLAAAGIPGLEGPDAKDNLCRYAVRSGSITTSDLATLD